MIQYHHQYTSRMDMHGRSTPLATDYCCLYPGKGFWLQLGLPPSETAVVWETGSAQNSARVALLICCCARIELTGGVRL